MSDDIQETPSSTPNFKTELAKKLQQLVPEAIADGKVDVTKLKELLGDDVDDGSERFGLFWPGKMRAIRAAQEPTTATLTPEPELSKNWDTTGNVFIEGDNLEALKILQKHYHGKIKMIYIDPPYNTGKDFVYSDNYQTGLQSYLNWTKQVNGEGQKLSSNFETDGRYHSHWLNMMYPRLKLARSLLSESGLVAVSIDENEVAHLRKILDEVYGENRFLAQFAIQNNPRGRAQDKYFATNHEYMIIYSRGDIARGSISLPKTKEQLASEYSFQDSAGAYRLLGLRNSHREFGRFNRPNLFYPLFVSKNGEVFLDAAEDRVKVLPLWSDGFEGCWTWGRPKAEKDRELLEGHSANGKMQVFVKDYANGATRKLKTLLTNKEYTTDAGQQAFNKLFNSSDKLFQAPKSPYLLADVLAAGTSKNDLILDFFAGSGSTAHAAFLLNTRELSERHWILVQLPEPTPGSSSAAKSGFKTIADIARKRIDLAGEKIKQDYAEQLAKRETPLDIGYRTYRLTDTNFAKWRESSATDQETLEQHLLDLRDSANDDATELALLTEVLLKQGYSLSEQVQKQTIAGLEVWSIGEHNLALAYVNERVKPTLDQLRALVDREPERLIILEDAFQGDDELKTNLVQAAKTKRVELWAA